MDLIIRSLREGALEPGQGPLLLLEDTLASVGGPAIFFQALAELAAALAQGRAQARRLAIVALDRSPAEYLSLCAGLPQAQLSIIDCFTDPYGWLARVLPGGALPPAACTSLAGGILHCQDGLQELLVQLGMQEGLGHVANNSSSSSIGGGSSGGGEGRAGTQQETPPPPLPVCCVVVDSLSTLLDRFGTRSVSWWLHRLCQAAGTSSLLCVLHADLHTPQALASLHSLAAGWVQLQPVSELERSLCLSPAGAQGGGGGAVPMGRISVQLKRRAGRARAQQQLYRVEMPQGGWQAGLGRQVEYWDAPAALPTPQALVETAGKPAAAAAPAGPAAAPALAAGGDCSEALARQMGGGMKLSLTPEEEEARRRVQLPYEHQGGGPAYQTGDWRDYLPPEAGGNAPSGGASAGAGGGAGGRRLGHILYVRDSGSEHDSDEDPDDDLDL